MTEDSIAASVYSFIFMDIHKSLFYRYADKNDSDDRMSLTDSYLYHEFIQTLLKSIEAEGSKSKYNKFCYFAHKEYKGKNICAYNIAKAFSSSM